MSQEVRHAWDQRPLVERAEIFLRAADLIAGKYRMDVMASTMIGQVSILLILSYLKSC